MIKASLDCPSEFIANVDVETRIQLFHLVSKRKKFKAVDFSRWLGDDFASSIIPMRRFVRILSTTALKCSRVLRRSRFLSIFERTVLDKSFHLRRVFPLSQSESQLRRLLLSASVYRTEFSSHIDECRCRPGVIFIFAEISFRSIQSLLCWYTSFPDCYFITVQGVPHLCSYACKFTVASFSERYPRESVFVKYLPFTHLSQRVLQSLWNLI